MDVMLLRMMMTTMMDEFVNNGFACCIGFVNKTKIWHELLELFYIDTLKLWIGYK